MLVCFVEDGEEITVNIVGRPLTPRAPRLTKNQQTMFRILHDAGSQGLTTEEWNAKARDAGLSTKRKADLFDARASLASRKLVRE